MVFVAVLLSLEGHIQVKAAGVARSGRWAGSGHWRGPAWRRQWAVGTPRLAVPQSGAVSTVPA